MTDGDRPGSVGSMRREQTQDQPKKEPSAEELEATRALDALVRSWRALESAREEEKDGAAGVPDPGRDFAGVAAVLEHNREAEEHARALSVLRAATARARRAFDDACHQALFVPETASVRHECDGRRYLVRRDAPRTRFEDEQGNEQGNQEEISQGNSEEPPAAAHGGADGVTRDGSGGAPGEDGAHAGSEDEVVFVIVDQGPVGGPEHAGGEHVSPLLAERRATVTERLSEERPGRGAESRRGRRREPPGSGPRRP